MKYLIQNEALISLPKILNFRSPKPSSFPKSSETLPKQQRRFPVLWQSCTQPCRRCSPHTPPPAPAPEPRRAAPAPAAPLQSLPQGSAPCSAVCPSHACGWRTTSRQLLLSVSTRRAGKPYSRPASPGQHRQPSQSPGGKLTASFHRDWL